MADPWESVLRLEALDAETRRDCWNQGVEAWAALGNPEQALRWARLGGDPAAVRRTEAAWETERARQQAILAGNLKAAGTRLAPPALPELAWNEAGDLALGITWIVRNGNADLVDMRGEGSRLLPLASTPAVEADLRKAAGQGVPLLLGPMGNARLVDLALASQPPLLLSMRPPLFVVEPDLGVFRMLCRLFDLSGPLAADPVLWFVGGDWAGRMSSFLRSNPAIVLPVLRAFPNGGLPAGDVDAVLAEASAWRDREAARLEAQMERLSAQRGAADGGRPRVLFLTSRFTTVLQYAARDFAEAFRSLGCETETVIERRDCEWDLRLPLRQRLCAFRPDFVFMLDHLRGEYAPAFPPSLPVVSWIMDRLPWLFERRLIDTLGSRDLVFGMWPEIRRDCLAAGYPEVHPLPVSGNALVYRPVERDPVCDLAFVSNLKVPETVPGLEGAEAILRAEGIGYRDLAFYARLCARLGVEATPERLQWLSFDLERWVQRTEPLRWARAMGLDVKVWGRGWEKSPEFAPIAQGTVEPGAPLRDLYASARIHLQMNSDTNVHARVFECLLSGGFPMAWAHPTDGEEGGLGSMLEIGKEVVTFSGKADFEAKVKRYLGDEGARRAVSEAGRSRTLSEHTTAHRAGEILRRAGLGA